MRFRRVFSASWRAAQAHAGGPRLLAKVGTYPITKLSELQKFLLSVSQRTSHEGSQTIIPKNRDEV